MDQVDYHYVADVASLGSTIRQRRKELGMTLDDLALQLGYSTRLLGEVERGIRNVPFDKLLNITNSLGIDLFYKTR